MGHRWTASLQKHVGALLSRSQCYCVSLDVFSKTWNRHRISKIVCFHDWIKSHSKHTVHPKSCRNVFSLCCQWLDRWWILIPFKGVVTQIRHPRITSQVESCKKAINVYERCQSLSGVSFLCSYMVDAADREKIEASRNELHNLLDKPQLQGIPVRGHCLALEFMRRKDCEVGV